MKLLDIYFKAVRKAKFEEELAEALFTAASLSSLMPFEEVVGQLGKGNGVLAREFKMASNQLAAGVGVKESLEGIKERVGSELCDRAVDLLVKAYETGGGAQHALREAAEDINSTIGLIKEHSARVTLEKMTMLLAGGVVVPLTLGALVSLVGSLGSFDMGFGSADKGLIVANAVLGNQIYIVEYALIASFFVGLQEHRPEKGLVYALVLVPLSFACFVIAKSLGF